MVPMVPMVPMVVEEYLSTDWKNYTTSRQRL